MSVTGHDNTIFGLRSVISSDSSYNVIIGADNYVTGNHNMVIGTNNKIEGSNNVIFGSGLTITRDNHLIVISTHVHKNMDIMFDDILIRKLTIFQYFVTEENIPIDILRYIVNYIYNIRLAKGEALGYCAGILRNAMDAF